MDEIEILAARLDQLEAELAIRRLAHHYCVGADRQDEARWVGVWTSDAVWQVSPDRAMTGQDEIVAGVRAQWEHFRQMQHGAVNHIVDLDPRDPERASGRADVVVHAQLPDGGWITGGGSYVDEYRRDEGVWRIGRRTVQNPFDLAPLSPGDGATIPGET